MIQIQNSISARGTKRFMSIVVMQSRTMRTIAQSDGHDSPGREIPVIVVNAMDLVEGDRARLASGTTGKEQFRSCWAGHAQSPSCSFFWALQGTNESRVVIRILYVEDNEDNVYMLKMRLELTDEFEVLVAEDGEKGCAMATSERPDLILMDLEMPVIDGWEATQRLKSKAETRDIPVIGLSAHALAGEREKALAAGCEDFDTKPVEFDRLVAKIKKFLEQKWG
jgi:CheY-like chemotaxis protein